MMVVLMWGWGREEEEHCSTTDLSSPATLSGGSLSRLEKPGIFWTNNLPHITYIEQRRAVREGGREGGRERCSLNK